MEVAREALDLLIALTAAIEATLVLIDNMILLLVEKLFNLVLVLLKCGKSFGNLTKFFIKLTTHCFIKKTNYINYSRIAPGCI
jgi:hypothetical protein